MSLFFVSCKNPVRQPWHKWVLVMLLIFSIGGHWLILQSGAWVGMFLSFSRTDSVEEAVVKTFDGKHPCKVCKFVSAEKKTEKKHDHQLSKVKIDYFLADNGQYSWDPDWSPLQFHWISGGSERNYSPPKPPPRYS